MFAVCYILSVILTKELVMATEQCEEYQFQSPFFPGVSCEEIYNMNPESQDKPGYYWILDGPNKVYCGMNYTGSSCEDIYNNNPETGDKSGYYRVNTEWTYCDMQAISTCFAGDAGVGGGWRRIAYIDTSTGGDCPIGWLRDIHSGIGFCRLVNDVYDTCSGANFSTSGTSYQRVCSRARGYHKGQSLGFHGYHTYGYDIDDASGYADGLLITYGSPRHHIWSYVNGQFDNKTNIHNCPCAGGFIPPLFVGTTITANQEQLIHMIPLPTTLMTHCGMDLAASLVDTATQPWFY